MKKNSKVSVIIPTYKRPHLIGRAIQSVLNQTYQNFEIVVVDNSPNNETEKAVKEFGNKRIKYFRNKIRANPAKSRNQGVRKSNQESKYIAFLDDDDEYFPRYLQKTVERLEEKKELAFVTTYAELRVQGRGKRLPKIHGKLEEFWRLAAGNGCVLRKKIFTKENIWFDEKMLFEDMDLGFRILQNSNNKVESIPEVLYVFYCYPAAEGESFTTTVTHSSELIEYFYKKHYLTYQKIGRKALAWLCCLTGNRLCMAGQIKKGRHYFLKACLTYPQLRYFLYYFISLVCPNLFQNIRLKILKQKFFRGKI